MSAPDIDWKVMNRFAALSGDTHLTVILGAGASAPSGLPTWNEFATRLAVLSGLVADTGAANMLLRMQDPTIVLEAAHARSGTLWPAHLNEALYGRPAQAADPSPVHLAAAGHYAAVPEATTLATLNFDSLLESALLTTGYPMVVIDAEGAEEVGVATVHHLHGAVFDGDAYSAVVGYNDFAELVADPRPWQREFLSAALARGPLLLAGTSYRDPDIRHWLHLIIRDERPDYRALVTIVREGLGLDRDTFNAVDDALTSEWESIGLQALTLHDLTDVALVIRELRHAGRSSYRPPAERARRVWTAHSRRFSALQSDYAKRLEIDAEAVSTTLGGSVHRATFWLANARGKLARWASAGTYYLGVRHLKLVPSGHDSPWIAGEAIGVEEVRVKDVERIPDITPTWRSVLAIPVFAGDGEHPDFATGVLTFGLSHTASALDARQDELNEMVSTLSSAWGTRINGVAFSSRDD